MNCAQIHFVTYSLLKCFLSVSPELDVNTWLYDQFEDPEEDGSRPEIIPLEAVQCQIARGTLGHTEPKMWITTTMDRVSCKYLGDYIS
jgi:hypothetical protein